MELFCLDLLKQTVLHELPQIQRIIIPQVIAQKYRRMLYLDCDIIVVGNIKNLVNTEMGDFAAAAVIDGSSNTRNREKLILNMPTNSHYFNSGVFLVDLDRWRDRGYSDKILSYARLNRDKINYADQGPINKVCWKDIIPLSEKYNFGVHATTDEKPVILHYCGPKPWLYIDTPGLEYYEFYRKRTPFLFERPKKRKFENIVFVKLKLIKLWALRRVRLSEEIRILKKLRRI